MRLLPLPFLLALLILPAFGQEAEILVLTNDVPEVQTIVVSKGGRVADVLAPLGVVRALAPSQRSLSAIQVACLAAPQVKAVESPKAVHSTRLSGPSAIPVINPAGPAQAASQQFALLGVLQALGAATVPVNSVLSPVTVAVLDSGADLAHPILAGRIHPASLDLVSPGQLPWDVANGIDDDGDGITDRAYGHGTHLAGLMALGCPTSQIMVLRVVDDEGYGDSFDVAAAIVHAVSHGARVINLSLSLPQPSLMVGEALAHAHSQGVLVLTSAGNAGQNLAEYPTGVVGVLTIGATDTMMLSPVNPMSMYPAETIASFSNWGHADFAAFGVGIISAWPGGSHARWDGTSMATGIASATAALMIAVDPAITRSEIVANSTATAVDVMSGHPYGATALGAGRIDTFGALLLTIANLP